MTDDAKKQDRSPEKKITETEEWVRKGYRPSGPPLDPRTKFEPQPTRATPAPPEPPSTSLPPPTSTGDNSGNSDK